MTEDQRRTLLGIRDRLHGVAARRANETALGWHDPIARDLRRIRDDLTAAIEDIDVAEEER
jgi:hypothetical protein